MVAVLAALADLMLVSILHCLPSSSLNFGSPCACSHRRSQGARWETFAVFFVLPFQIHAFRNVLMSKLSFRCLSMYVASKSGLVSTSRRLLPGTLHHPIRNLRLPCLGPAFHELRSERDWPFFLRGLCTSAPTMCRGLLLPLIFNVFLGGERCWRTDVCPPRACSFDATSSCANLAY